MGACQSDPRPTVVPETEVPKEVKVVAPIYDEESEKQAIRIQSAARGYKAKQEVEDLKQLVKTHQPPAEVAVSYTGPMESDKLQVQKIEQQKFNHPARPEFKDLIRLPPYKFLATNAIYKGQWNQGKRHGRGIQVWPDGSVYQGDWIDDMADGKGRLIHPDGDYYQGDWKKDRANGNGTFIHVDGNRYDGQWVDDKQHGVGVEQQKDFVYNGHFEFGLKQGKGKIIWNIDGSTYEGDFFEGLMQGEGKFLFANGKTYVGQWFQSKMHGAGQLIYPDGKIYTGNFENGQKSGHGKMEYPDGKIFEGEWKNGKQNGAGQVTTPDGRTGQGVWENGKRLKDHQHDQYQ